MLQRTAVTDSFLFLFCVHAHKRNMMSLADNLIVMNHMSPSLLIATPRYSADSARGEPRHLKQSVYIQTGGWMYHMLLWS